MSSLTHSRKKSVITPFGKNVKALAFLLNNYCNVSIDKTQELIQGITDDKIILSKGLINSLSRQSSDATVSDRKIIYDIYTKMKLNK